MNFAVTTLLLAAALSAEIRGNESLPPALGQGLHNNFHFLLKSSAPARVFMEWCSWGWETRSFEAGKARLTRRPSAWDKNFPATHSLKPGEVLITDINLCDGTWVADPALPVSPGPLKLTGVFTIRKDKDAIAEKVWTGTVRSAPLEIQIDKSCLATLNKR